MTVYTLTAQVNSYSPYSSLGLGYLYGSGSIFNLSMGGLGVSTSSLYNVNYINPATYGHLSSTAFEIGSISSFSKLSQRSLEQNNFISGLTNISLGFPISNRLGFAVALIPYTSVGYNVVNETPSNNEDIGLLNYTYSGSGGINKLLFGIGGKIIDNMLKTDISAGFNLNYLFGPINRVSELSIENSIVEFREQNSLFIGDVSFDFGLLISHSLKDYTINLATKFSPEATLTTSKNIFNHTYISSGELESFLDTIFYTQGDKGDINMPLAYSLGLSLASNSDWLIGIDYNYTNWENYSEIGESIGYMNNKNEFIFGGSFIPKKTDIHNYLNRIEYRFGFSYASGYIDLSEVSGVLSDDSHLLQDMSISLGFALPMNRVTSKVNLGFKYGFRGALNQALDNSTNIKERYFNLYMAMTLNEKWFKKRKIE